MGMASKKPKASSAPKPLRGVVVGNSAQEKVDGHRFYNLHVRVALPLATGGGETDEPYQTQSSNADYLSGKAVTVTVED